MTSIRGACDGMPLELTEEWTGYNNAVTMQVGLWIRNDGEHIERARLVAVEEGPSQLRRHLTNIMYCANRSSAPGLTWVAVANKAGAIDWAQIAYDLIGDEPDGDDLAAVRADCAFPGLMTDAEIFREAVRRRAVRARELALTDERG